VTSTASEIGRIADCVNRRFIHAGLSADTSIPRTMRATKRSQPTRPRIGAASSSCTAKPPAVGAGTASAAGSRNGWPVACEYSRATPRIEKQ